MSAHAEATVTCAAPAVPAYGHPPVLPLRHICHIASDTVADHPEWLAAYHAPLSADEQWYIDDREAARAAAQDRAANAAIEPGEYLPEPTRTTGPMAAPPADEAETILPGSMEARALDERTEESPGRVQRGARRDAGRDGRAERHRDSRARQAREAEEVAPVTAPPD